MPRLRSRIGKAMHDIQSSNPIGEFFQGFHKERHSRSIDGCIGNSNIVEIQKDSDAAFDGWWSCDCCTSSSSSSIGAEKGCKFWRNLTR